MYVTLCLMCLIIQYLPESNIVRLFVYMPNAWQTNNQQFILSKLFAKPFKPMKYLSAKANEKMMDSYIFYS